jgi:hypothetical protein
VSPAGDGRATLRIERTFDAPAVKVFAAWTSVEVMRRWWHAEHTWETPIAEVDPRVGGRLRLVMRNPAEGAEYAGSGEYTIVRSAAMEGVQRRGRAPSQRRRGLGSMRNDARRAGTRSPRCR